MCVYTCSRARAPHLVVLHPSYPISGDWSPFSIGTDPELWMDLVLGDHLASEDMSQEQIVVHRLRHDLRDRGRIELEERIVFRLAGLENVGRRAKGEDAVPHLFVPGYPETQDHAELREIRSKLILVKAVRETTDRDDALVVFLWWDERSCGMG